MANSDDPEPQPAHDLRFDDWPITRYERWENWPVERETSAERPSDAQTEGVEWLGFAGGASGGAAFMYKPESSTIHRGDVDEANERVVLGERHDEVDSEESLGERLEALGEEHDWTWLSSFAREHLEDDDAEGIDDYRTPEGVDHEFTEFQQRNVLDDAEPDLGFFGSHTFSDESDREHMLERDFDVYLEEGGDRAAVQVIERYLVAAEPNAERREGDANMVDEQEYELAVDVEDDAAWEGHLEASLEEWHERHIAPPPGDMTEA